MEKKTVARAYYDESYTPMPTKSTLYWRKNLIWQAWRFIVLNLKMMRIIVGGIPEKKGPTVSCKSLRVIKSG
jgi:hypothetical protein